METVHVNINMTLPHSKSERRVSMSKRTQRGEIHRNYGKDSAFVMAGKGLKSMVSDEKKSLRKPGMHSRSYAPKTLNLFEDTQEAVGITAEEAIAADEFFDEVISTSMYSKPSLPRATLPPIAAHAPRNVRVDKSDYEKKKGPVKRKQVSPVASASSSKENGASSWSMERKREKPNLKKAKAEAQGKEAEAEEGLDMPDWVESLWDNSDRHAAGFSLVEKFFGSSSKNQQERRRNRPYFTYWVTIVQIILYIVSVCYYGIAPLGTSQTSITGEVLMTSLAIENVAYSEYDNLWIGPTQADLIHMGAKYSPCMRKDSNINAAIAFDQAKEKEQACCVYNDGSGCVMSEKSDCSSTLATWINWTVSDPGPDGRLSGSVCGQDPAYCTDPASTGAFQWDDDFTEWPVCKKTDAPASGSRDYHMLFEVVGRPCCVGIRGECIIATREYCDFRKGYFHENSSVCAQVNCMNEICAMIDFTDPLEPDQFYRFFTSLFLSSGVLALVITLLFQLTIQRDLEKLIGWFPMTVLYIGGGVVGSLASATFIPYYVEAGASGSQFAVIAAMFVEVLRWNKDENPGKTIGKIILVLIILFLLGAVVSAIDNYAHLFGLFFGFFVAFGFRPFLTRDGEAVSKGCLIFTRILMFFFAIALFAILVVVYYLAPVTHCDACMYFNCIPFTDTYCDGMSVNIQREGQTEVSDA